MTKPIYYLATPYTDFDQGHEQAFIAACRAAAVLMKQGMFVYSPIAHSHPIAVHGGLDPIDHKFWLNQDKAMLEDCVALLVVMMPGWRESRGIRAEIEYAEEMEKPICFLSWPMLTVRENVQIQEAHSAG